MSSWDKALPVKRVERGWTLLSYPSWLLPSWSGVEKGLPKSEEFGVNRDLTKWWNTGIEEDFLAVWPPRSGAKELNLRRTRAADVREICGRRKCTSEVKQALNDLKGEFDYTTVLNLAWARILFGPSWWIRWKAWGAFDNGIDHFRLVAKHVNDYVKTHPMDDPEWPRYVECAALTGYRLLPVKGFEYFEEMQALAQGGEPHYSPPGTTFEADAARILKMDVPPVEWMDFEDFVDSDVWITSGASSEGRLDVVINGKVKGLKARKNFVADCLNLRALAKQALQHQDQVSTVIIKNEAGKVRLAVASDILTYLKMAWLIRMLGGAYTQWPGNTLNEDTIEKATRLEFIWQELQTKYGMSFDFKAFDHQPTTDELKTLFRIAAEQGARNVPEEKLASWKLMIASVVASFDKSTLQGNDGKEERKMHVTGGLMSGLYVTSIIGNAWNALFTVRGTELLGKAGVNLEGHRFWTQGDDSLQLSGHPETLMLAELALRKQGAITAAGKNALLKGRGEYLRVALQKGGNAGYPVRALIGLTQRKPWSNEPWDEASTLTALRSVCDTLTRRGCEAFDIFQAIAKRWCRRNRLPFAVVSVPTQFGGLGLIVWDGFTMLTDKFPRVEKDPLTFNNMTTWRRDRLLRRAAQLNIPVTVEYADFVARKQLTAVVVSDEIPTIRLEYRKKWKDKLKTTTISTYSLPERLMASRVARLDWQPTDGYALLHRMGKASVGTFGMYRRETGSITDAALFLREKGLTLRSWLEAERPSFWQTLKNLGFKRTTDGIAWLTGQVSYPPTSIHPDLRSLVTQRLAALCLVNGKRRNMVRVFNSLAEDVSYSLQRTAYVQQLYQW